MCYPRNYVSVGVGRGNVLALYLHVGGVGRRNVLASYLRVGGYWEEKCVSLVVTCG